MVGRKNVFVLLVEEILLLNIGIGWYEVVILIVKILIFLKVLLIGEFLFDY